MIGILFSGGKDSVFTLYYYLEQGWDVSCLISLKSNNPQSWMFHTPAISMVNLQAEALGIPLIEHETKGEKEDELVDLKNALLEAKKKFGIRGVAVGALLSDYQQERVNRVCHSIGLKCFAPLWHKDQEKLLSEVINAGFDVRLSAVASHGLSPELVGKKIDSKMLAFFSGLHKKFGFHIAGEGGEYESLVVDGPIFKKAVVLSDFKVVEDGSSARIEILGAKLSEK